MTSSPGICRRLPARESAEHGADGQAKTSEGAFCEDVSAHNFPPPENILERPPPLFDDSRAFVHSDSHVRKRNPRPQGQAVKRRAIDGHGPIALWRREASRASAVQAVHASLRVSCRGAIKFRERIHEDAGIQSKLG